MNFEKTKICRGINLSIKFCNSIIVKAKAMGSQKNGVSADSYWYSVQMPLPCCKAFVSNGISNLIGAMLIAIGIPDWLRCRNFSDNVTKILISIALLMSCFSLTTFAQLNTDIYLMDIDLKGDNLNYSNLTNITNRKGYDNQPHFSKDGSHLLYSSIRADEQADIYKYDIESGKTEQLTATKANEFSPTYFKDHKFISAVQQDVDSSQHLILIKQTGGKRKVLLKKEKLIGYHSWVSKREVALFIVGEPHELHRAKKRAKAATKIDDKIGSTLQKVPYRKAVGYQFFEDPATCLMKEYFYKGKFAKTLCNCAGDASSFVYLKNGNLISGIGQQLFLFDKRAAAKGWVLIADFSEFSNFDFYRIAINRQETQMALVVYRRK